MIDEAALERLTTARRSLLDRLIELNAAHLRLESRRAGLELQLGAARRPGSGRPDAAEAARLAAVEQERDDALTSIAGLEAERAELGAELEAIIERLARPLTS